MIIHSQDEWGPFVHMAEGDMHTEADWYAIGARKPNYPVPVVIHEIAHMHVAADNSMMIWYCDGGIATFF